MTASEAPLTLEDLLTCPCCANARRCYLGRGLELAATVTLSHAIIGSSGGASPLTVSPEWSIPPGEIPVDTGGDGRMFGSELVDSLASPMDATVAVREQTVEVRGGFGVNNRFLTLAQWDHTDGYNYIVTARLDGARWNVSPFFIAPEDEWMPSTGAQWASGGQADTPEARFTVQWYLSRRLQSSTLQHAIYSNLGNHELWRVESAYGVELARTPLEYEATWGDLAEWGQNAGVNFSYTAISATLGPPARSGLCRPTDEFW